MSDNFSENGAHSNPSNAEEERLLNEIERALQARNSPVHQPSQVPVLNELVNTVPQVDPTFKNVLEARLIDALIQAQPPHQPETSQEIADMESITQFKQQDYDRPYTVKPRSQRLQLAFVAGLLATLIGVSMMLAFSQMPGDDPPPAAGIGAGEQEQDDVEIAQEVVTATPTITASWTFTPTEPVNVTPTPSATLTFTPTQNLADLATIPIPAGYRVTTLNLNDVTVNTDIRGMRRIIIEYVTNDQTISISTQAIIVGEVEGQADVILVAMPMQDFENGEDFLQNQTNIQLTPADSFQPTEAELNAMLEEFELPADWVFTTIPVTQIIGSRSLNGAQAVIEAQIGLSRDERRSLTISRENYFNPYIPRTNPLFLGDGDDFDLYIGVLLPQEDARLLEVMIDGGYQVSITSADMDQLPEGTVAVNVPAPSLVFDDVLAIGDRVDILAALSFVDADEEFQELVPVNTSDASNQWLVPLPDTAETTEGTPQLVIQQIISDAIVLQVSDSITLAVSAEDATILNYLIDANIPLALVHSD